MDPVTAVSQALAAAFGIWKDERARHFALRNERLSREYYEEKRKPDPNMALLDDIEHRQHVLCVDFVTAASGGQKAQTPS